MGTLPTTKHVKNLMFEVFCFYQISVLVFVLEGDVVRRTQLVPENSLHHQDKLVVRNVLKQRNPLRRIHLT